MLLLLWKAVNELLICCFRTKSKRSLWRECPDPVAHISGTNPALFALCFMVTHNKSTTSFFNGAQFKKVIGAPVAPVCWLRHSSRLEEQQQGHCDGRLVEQRHPQWWRLLYRRLFHILNRSAPQQIRITEQFITWTLILLHSYPFIPELLCVTCRYTPDLQCVTKIGKNELFLPLPLICQADSWQTCRYLSHC